MMFCCEVVDINFDDISTASAYIHTDITIIIIIIIIIYGVYICVFVCVDIHIYYHILMGKRTNQSNSGVVMICDSALEKETCIFR